MRSFSLHFLVLFSLTAFLLPASRLTAQQGWLTHFEQSGFVSSPDFDETMQWLRRLDSASEWIALRGFGMTPQGRELPLVILSSDRAFTPEQAHATGKDIVLIQAGIHAGEIDGKDAGMMLLRDIAVTRTLAHLADHVIILFMPIFNADGHERQSPYNRINQDGPAVMGWRATANNLNLNRDYMKADAAEMRAWLALFNDWLPDMLIDCHVTNGIDFQYNLTWAMEMYGNMHPAVAAWERGLMHSFIDAMEKAGDPVFPYVFPREDRDVSKGLVDWASPPRLSAGYAAIRNRANLLVETHSLKPFRDRVFSTYRFLQAVLEYIAGHPGTLRASVLEAERDDIRRFTAVDTTAFPLRFQASDQARMVTFKGYATELVNSEISGGSYLRYDRSRPQTVEAPLYDDVQPTHSIRPPRAYLIPREWSVVVDILRLHGLTVQQLTQDVTLPCERISFSDVTWRNRPYEGRFTVTAQSRLFMDTIPFPAGTWVVDVAQAGGRVAMHFLEADAPDSFLFWGFFHSIFEQKEYYEGYVFEEILPGMLRELPKLQHEFEEKIASDTAFAASPRARLNFLYQRSPWHDSNINVYPVARCMYIEALPLGVYAPFRRQSRFSDAEE